jgi:hypothetical protein
LILFQNGVQSCPQVVSSSLPVIFAASFSSNEQTIRPAFLIR